MPVDEATRRAVGGLEVRGARWRIGRRSRACDSAAGGAGFAGAASVCAVSSLAGVNFERAAVAVWGVERAADGGRACRRRAKPSAGDPVFIRGEGQNEPRFRLPQLSTHAPTHPRTTLHASQPNSILRATSCTSSALPVCTHHHWPSCCGGGLALRHAFLLPGEAAGAQRNSVCLYGRLFVYQYICYHGEAISRGLDCDSGLALTLSFMHTWPSSASREITVRCNFDTPKVSMTTSPHAKITARQPLRSHAKTCAATRIQCLFHDGPLTAAATPMWVRRASRKFPAALSDKSASA
ncbi:hypothetical protein P171DRAFT_206823 [Karstenula rhodostoma CBS 690.94]|uniref:Uncharacterized protein n=1 Tax=Karstenula rhodostoma CBS 690.94 TaxID=1392251 RepID=A0A9P4PRY1_9PLEO|nr:hypothetical protein P171DRAFT_206823 [Karstenula rhodostoma CBS 690.94]